jgi:hypothetical protein
LSTEQRVAIAFLQSEINHRREKLANGNKMRRQTTEERSANPTSFGYARFCLTDDERKQLAWQIEIFELYLRRVYDPNSEPINAIEIFKKYFPDYVDEPKSGLRTLELTSK